MAEVLHLLGRNHMFIKTLQVAVLMTTNNMTWPWGGVHCPKTCMNTLLNPAAIRVSSHVLYTLTALTRQILRSFFAQSASLRISPPHYSAVSHSAFISAASPASPSHLNLVRKSVSPDPQQSYKHLRLRFSDVVFYEEARSWRH